MKCWLTVLSFASVCGLLSMAAAEAPAGSESGDDVRQREARSFNGGQNYNRFFGQGLHSHQGNTMVNWNSLLSKRKRQMEFYPSNGFRQGLADNGLQDWSTAFGRDGRGFAAPPSNRLSALDSAGDARLDAMQNWRAFYSRQSRRSGAKSFDDKESFDGNES